MTPYILIICSIWILTKIYMAQREKQAKQISDMIDFNFLRGTSELTVVKDDINILSKVSNIEEIMVYSATGEEITLRATDMLRDSELDLNPFTYIIENNLLDVELDFLLENPQLFKRVQETGILSYNLEILDEFARKTSIQNFSITLNQSLRRFFEDEDATNLNIGIEIVTIDSIQISLNYVLPSAYLSDYRNTNESF